MSRQGGTAKGMRRRDASLRSRARYRFDAGLSRGAGVVMGWLGLATLAIVLVAAAVFAFVHLTGVNGGEPLGLGEAVWQALLRVLDSGAFAADLGWPTRVVALVVTLAGIFLAGSLIGLIASAIDQRIEALRRGRSAVLEEGHTLILGWSERVPTVVSELVLANESMRDAAIVLLTTSDKTEVEQLLREAIQDWRTTRLVVRSGSPSSPADLELVHFAGARSVLVMATGAGTPETVKTLLAVRSLDPELRGCHVVAEVEDAPAAASLRALFGPRLVTVDSAEVIAELTAQACRQRGLSMVFRTLLDFDGDEIYMASFPELVGRTYGEALGAFERAAIMGLLDQDGAVWLNPQHDRVLLPGEQLIGIAEDDSRFVCTGLTAVDPVALPEGSTIELRRRRIVVVGWSSLGSRVVEELDEFLGPETVIELLLDPTLVSVDAVAAQISTRNVTVELTEIEGGPEVVAAHAARVAFHEVIVLGYRGMLEIQEADALTLLMVLAFRQVRRADADLEPVRVVAELLDQRNAPLAAASGVDDFIVSDELTSLMLAQLSERQELATVFADLFDRAGATIELVPVRLLAADRAASFGQLVATAARAGWSALGYRRAEDGAVVVNPTKSAPLSLRPNDEVLVLRAGLAATSGSVSTLVDGSVGG